LGAGAAGVLLVWLSIGAIARSLASTLPRSGAIALDGEVLAVAFLVSLATGIAAGWAPAWRSAKVDLIEALKQGLGRGDADALAGRPRGLLVGCEVALSAMLLIGAGLLVRSLVSLRGTDPGFDPEHVLTLNLPTTAAAYPTAERTMAYLEEARR